jgi:AraC-like DNA-binding protein
MEKTLNIYLDEKKHNIFLQNGFYKTSYSSGAMHKHCYTEMHIVKGQHAFLSVENSTYNLSHGNVFLIPANTFHSIELSQDSKHTAFQIDYNIKDFKYFNANCAIISELFDKISETNITGNHQEVLAYIQFFCNLFIKPESSVDDITDYKFLIYEFFSVSYNENIRLSDLALTLNLSERQTERLVKLYTGNSFSKELTKTRMDIANRLLKSTDMSLTEIANYVGFRSYNGFWKAMKKINQIT